MVQSIHGYAHLELTVLMIFTSFYEQPFLLTMETRTDKHRSKNKLLGLLLLPPRNKTWQVVSNLMVKNGLYLICIISLMLTQKFIYDKCSF